ncbi:hypothetical protein D3C71_1323130 [compost metagenome]
MDPRPLRQTSARPATGPNAARPVRQWRVACPPESAAGRRPGQPSSWAPRRTPRLATRAACPCREWRWRGHRSTPGTVPSPGGAGCPRPRTHNCPAARYASTARRPACRSAWNRARSPTRWARPPAWTPASGCGPGHKAGSCIARGSTPACSCPPSSRCSRRARHGQSLAPRRWWRRPGGFPRRPLAPAHRPRAWPRCGWRYRCRLRH